MSSRKSSFYRHLKNDPLNFKAQKKLKTCTGSQQITSSALVDCNIESSEVTSVPETENLVLHHSELNSLENSDVENFESGINHMDFEISIYIGDHVINNNRY